MGALMLMQAAAGADAVTWDVPAQCPTQDVLQAEVRRLLGGAEPDLTDVRVEGRVTQSGGGFSLRLVVQTSDGSTERRLDSPTCEPLVDSAALYVAMAVDAVKTVEKTQEPPPTPAIEIPESTPAETPRPRAFDLRISGGANVAAYARTGGLGSLTASFLRGGVRLEVGATFSGWAPIPLSPNASPAASIIAGGGDLRVCPSFRRDEVELFGCGGVHVGAHRARAVAVDETTVARRVSADVLIGTGVAWWPAPRFGLWLEPNMALALHRPRFVISGLEGSFTQGAVSARVTLGVVVRLRSNAGTHGKGGRG